MKHNTLLFRPRVHDKNSEGECLTGYFQAKSLHMLEGIHKLIEQRLNLTLQLMIENCYRCRVLLIDAIPVWIPSDICSDFVQVALAVFIVQTIIPYFDS